MTRTREFHWPVRVYYEDTDAGGVVYYANYLRFMERARTEWLRHLGFEQDVLLAREGILFAVRRVALEFRHPARFNDRLTVRSRIRQRRRASLVFHQEIIRAVDQQLLCDGDVQVACIAAGSFRPHPIPAALLEAVPDGF